MLDKRHSMRYHRSNKTTVQEIYMKTLYCDICRKELENPVASRNYFHIREFDLCEPCKDTIDARLRPVVRSHFPYSPEWFEQTLVGMVEKAVSTGRP